MCGLAVIVEKAREAFISDHVFKHMILFTKRTKLVGKKECAGFPSADIRHVAYFKNNGAVEILIRKRMEENVVDNAEDDCGSANAKGQREDGE